VADKGQPAFRVEGHRHRRAGQAALAGDTLQTAH
jgi:hypothetical protein